MPLYAGTQAIHHLLRALTQITKITSDIDLAMAPGYTRRRRFPWRDSLGLSQHTERMVKWRVKGLSCCALFVCLALSTSAYLTSNSKQQYVQSPQQESSGASSRRLLSTNATEAHGPEWEQCTFEEEHLPGAWVFSHAICILIIFIALAIICDDFFVPSLEIISEKLQLSEDVAGATFMAAGSSAPELFTSVAGVVVRTDVGVGTIVGSAVFNLLIIIALTGALAGQVLHLDWRPMMRDSFFYAMSIGCFIGFSWDGYFQHYEACILLLLYITYIVLMFFNPRIMDWMATWRCCGRGPAVAPSEHGSEKESSPDPSGEAGLNHSNPKLHEERRHHGSAVAATHKTQYGSDPTAISEEDSETANGGMNGSVKDGINGDIKPVKEKEGSDKEQEEEEDEEETIQICPCLPCCCPVRTQTPSSEEARTKGGFVNWAKLILRWLLFIPAFPFVCLFSWTIPDCSKEKNKKYFILSFLMSVLWIAILSFGMVTLVGRAGCIIGIDTYIMGVIVIAIGTSIPDALSSILVARDGYGDMAVSNAIGSNVFDINLGLGLPFIIRIAIDKGIPIELLDDEEWSDYNSGAMNMIPHAKFGFLLLLILAIAIAIFFISKFRLSKWIGICFVILYFCFITYTLTQELYCVRELGKYC